VYWIQLGQDRDQWRSTVNTVIILQFQLSNWWLIYWLWWVRLCLRTAATNGPVVHPPGDMRAWRAMVMMPAEDNIWLVHQSSLAILPAQTSWTSRRNGRKSENFASQYLKYFKGSLTCRKILRHGTSGFTSHSKKGVLRTFIALKVHRHGQFWTRDPCVQW
jgi:hypothetical protein